MAYRKADPVPDAHGESMVLEWAVGEPEPMRPEQYPPFTPKTTPSGDILFTTRTVDPVAAAAEAQAVGAVDEHGDNRHPLARQGRPHPPADAPAQGTHGDAGGGGLPGQPLPGGRRVGASWSRAAPAKEMVMVEDSPEKEVHREKLKTTVVALDLHGGEITDIAA